MTNNLKKKLLVDFGKKNINKKIDKKKIIKLILFKNPLIEEIINWYFIENFLIYLFLKFLKFLNCTKLIYRYKKTILFLFLTTNTDFLMIISIFFFYFIQILFIFFFNE